MSCTSWFVVVGLALLASGLARADNDPTREELRQLLEEGRKNRTARPEFLEKLETILEKNRGARPRSLLLERFDDGDFEHNPAWTVVGGTFHIDALGALFSSTSHDDSLPMQSSGENSEAAVPSERDAELNMVMGLVGLLADGKIPGRQGAVVRDRRGTKTGGEGAVIHVPVAVPNVFSLRFLFRADAAQGEAQVGLFLGQDFDSGYRLLLNADPDRERTVAVVRYNDQGHPEQLAMIPGNGLGDGLGHEVSWKRTDNGIMTIGVDGRNLLQLRDVVISGGFDGLVLVNHGGAMAFDTIDLSTTR
ncbi:MAG: hypothetical protein HQL76_02535 [Magnetococcales bacterium]|nr:hypothetical protein [Magnetococcales bacterium]